MQVSQDRIRKPVTEDGTAGVDLRHVTQNPWPNPWTVKCHHIVPQSNFVTRACGDELLDGMGQSIPSSCIPEENGLARRRCLRNV